MKRLGNLYEKAFTREALHSAYLEARRGKRGRNSCYQFEKNLSKNIEDLYTSLRDRTYVPSGYYQFYVYEPKKRLISAPSFWDRVVQHAIYRTIYPIFDSKFIHQSYGCRIGKGTHKAANYVYDCIQRVDEDSYILQLDISKYYYSIDRDILKSQILKYIKDIDLVNIIMLFIEDATGVPVGNLLSQLFGLIYLNVLDHFVKRKLSVKMYARYVDDFILLGLTKEQSLQYRKDIEEFLSSELKLSLSKVIRHKIGKGVNFVGFRMWKDKKLVRKRSLYTYRKSVKSGKIVSIISSLGHAKHSHSYKHMLKYLEGKDNGLFNQLPKSLRPIYTVCS